MLDTVLYILLFVVCLSTLIMVHEAGHLIAAKAFNVFCVEYSVGFGPKIVSIKGRKAETAFSIRGIPFGGYVSMYGEGVTLPEGVTVDEKRSLNGIKKWKRAIILVAGVTMNAILALVLFFVANVACPNKTAYISYLTISENSTASYAEVLKDNSRIVISHDSDTDGDRYYVDKEAFIYYNDESLEPTKVALALKVNSDNLTFTDLTWNRYLTIYGYEEDSISTKEFELTSAIKCLSFNISYATDVDQDGNITASNKLPITSKVIETRADGFVLESLDINIFLDVERNTFGEAIKYTFEDFGESAIMIFKSLGMLFSNPTSIKDVSGIVGIAFVSSSYLKNYGVGPFIRIWAMVSVNLAIVNLIPFPGLDGWQLFVTAFEAIFKKKIPEKAKNIASLIGIGILFVLMAVVLVLDILRYGVGLL